MAQRQILRTRKVPEARPILAQDLAKEEIENRSAIGRSVCHEIGYINTQGLAQQVTCLKAKNVYGQMEPAPLKTN